MSVIRAGLITTIACIIIFQKLWLTLLHTVSRGGGVAIRFRALD